MCTIRQQIISDAAADEILDGSTKAISTGTDGDSGGAGDMSAGTGGKNDRYHLQRWVERAGNGVGSGMKKKKKIITICLLSFPTRLSIFYTCLSNMHQPRNRVHTHISNFIVPDKKKCWACYIFSFLHCLPPCFVLGLKDEFLSQGWIIRWDFHIK